MITLYDLEEEVRQEVRAWAEDHPNNDDIDYDGSLYGIVDSAVPIYTGDLMELAANNIALASDKPELGPAFDGAPTPVNIVAANVYEHLSGVAWVEWQTILDERKEMTE